MNWIVWLLIIWISLSLGIGVLWLLGSFFMWLYQEYYEGNDNEDTTL